MTPDQILAIIMLLQAFGVSPQIANNVQTILQNAHTVEVQQTQDTQTDIGGESIPQTQQDEQSIQPPVIPPVAFVGQPLVVLADAAHLYRPTVSWSSNIDAQATIVGCTLGVNPKCGAPFTTMQGTDFFYEMPGASETVYSKYKITLSANGTTAVYTANYPRP